MKNVQICDATWIIKSGGGTAKTLRIGKKYQKESSNSIMYFIVPIISYSSRPEEILKSN